MANQPIRMTVTRLC